jgi:hypothetical protein
MIDPKAVAGQHHRVAEGLVGFEPPHQAADASDDGDHPPVLGPDLGVHFIEQRTRTDDLGGASQDQSTPQDLAARVIAAADPGYDDAWQAYLDRQHVNHESGDQILMITFAEPGASGDAWNR